MNFLTKLVPISFLLGAIAGPLVMVVFQYIKKFRGIIDGQSAFAKNAWLFVFIQIFAVLQAVVSTDLPSCTMDMAGGIGACLDQITPAMIKGLIVQGGAIVSFKLKKMPSA